MVVLDPELHIGVLLRRMVATTTIIIWMEIHTIIQIVIIVVISGSQIINDWLRHW